MNDRSNTNETPPANLDWESIDWDRVHNKTSTELVEALRLHFIDGGGIPAEISYRLLLLGCAADAMKAKYLKGVSDG